MLVLSRSSLSAGQVGPALRDAKLWPSCAGPAFPVSCLSVLPIGRTGWPCTVLCKALLQYPSFAGPVFFLSSLSAGQVSQELCDASFPS